MIAHLHSISEVYVGERVSFVWCIGALVVHAGLKCYWYGKVLGSGSLSDVDRGGEGMEAERKRRPERWV